MTREFYTPQEFRLLFKPNLGRDTVYRLLQENRVRAIRTGERNYLIPRDEVGKFIERELNRQDSALQ